MREFKFRVWDVVEERMRIIAKLDFPAWIVCVCDDKLNYQCERNSFQNQESDKFILMQYTCLKDKNGVEIYEGDIVRKLSGDYKLGKVVFEFGMFCFESIGCGIYAGSDAFLHIHSLHYKEYNSNNNYEVIGNIYENHELLESK